MADNTITMELQSGFTITISRLCPYYLDFIQDVYKYKPLPHRTILLASGDSVESQYVFEGTIPSEDDPDYELYIQYVAAVEYNDNIDTRRKLAREDFLLATCITIVNGPYTIDDVEWKLRMEAAFQDRGWRLPTHRGELQLIFIKHAIRSGHERTTILRYAMYEEVTEYELNRALDMFRSAI